MDRKFTISTVVVFVVLMLGGFLVHGLWLGPTYETMTSMMRPMAEQEAMMHFMLIAHLLMAAAFVWVYQRGNEDKPWVQQGIRFGIAIAFAVVDSIFHDLLHSAADAGYAGDQSVDR